jgi:ABC-type nitrate/sulfonate/bicarbonate transport system permease component
MSTRAESKDRSVASAAPVGDEIRPARVRRALVGIGLPILGIALALGIWQLLSFAMGVYTMPGPLVTARHLADNFFHSDYLESHGLSSGVGYLTHASYTVRNVVIGVALGTGIGVAIGLLSMRLPVLAEIVTPITATFGAAPIFVAAPFFLIWFGIVPTAQILMVTFYTTILMYIFSRRAAENLASLYVESALTLGGTSWSIFRWIYVPGTVPEIRGGFRVALAGSWGLAAIAELLGSQQGVGFLIKFYATAFVIDGMLALTVLLGLVAIVFDRIILLVFAYLTRWAESGRRLAL